MYLFLAQNSINGKIVDENAILQLDQPSQLSTTLGTTVDISGNYQLNNIPNGTQTLVISFIGYKTINQTIIIGK